MIPSSDWNNKLLFRDCLGEFKIQIPQTWLKISNDQKID
jgi:hypothetical protein